MSEERDGSNEHLDRTTEIVASICGASQAASEAAKRSEPHGSNEKAVYSGQVRPLEEHALKDWALQISYGYLKTIFSLNMLIGTLGLVLNTRFI